MTKPSICLSMIVKDEAHIIQRCLESVKPLIDSYVIHDTGSTDGTQDVIRTVMGDIPGQVTSRPWANFSENRNQALDEARLRGEFVLIMDADDWLEIDGRVPPIGDHDVYNLEIRSGSLSFHRPLLVRSTLPARFVGAVHEFLEVSQDHVGVLKRAFVHSTRDGARSSNPAKYRRDALLLEGEHIREPENTRTVFYLAQSYRDAGDNELALRYYDRRVKMPHGWADEGWYSLYQIGAIRERMGIFSHESSVAAYLRAFEFMPDRAEPLYRAAMLHQNRSEYATSHMLLERAARIQKPAVTRLYVEPEVYDVQVPMELAVASYYVDDHAAAVRLNKTLLHGSKLNPGQRETVKRNLAFSAPHVGHSRTPTQQRRSA